MHRIGERARFWVVALVLAAGAWWMLFHVPERVRPPGVLCAKPPEQGPLDHAPKPVRRVAGWTLSPLADYKVRARVISARHYRFDYPAPLSPVDLALGWGRMSDSAVLAKIDVTQHDRWYECRVRDGVITPRELTLSSANTHLIPEDDAVRETLLGAIRGDIVTLEGSLVECRPDGGGAPWRSSLSRADTEGGAGEIMYVRRASVE